MIVSVVSSSLGNATNFNVLRQGWSLSCSRAAVVVERREGGRKECSANAQSLASVFPAGELCSSHTTDHMSESCYICVCEEYNPRGKVLMSARM